MKHFSLLVFLCRRYRYRENTLQESEVYFNPTELLKAGIQALTAISDKTRIIKQ